MSADEPSDLFAGLCFYIDVGPGCSQLLKVLKGQIAKHQGEVAESLTHSVNHVILRHQQQPVYAAASALPGVALVRPTWVWECVCHQRLQPYVNQEPYPCEAIPGAQSVSASLTGIKGPERTFVIYQIQAMGVTYSGGFRPARDVLLVPPPDKPVDCSEKVHEALKAGTNLLCYNWVQACIAAWAVVPTGPYDLKEQYRALAQASAAAAARKDAPPPPPAGDTTAAAAEGRVLASAVTAVSDSLTPADAAGRLQSPATCNGPAQLPLPAAAAALSGQSGLQQQEGVAGAQGVHMQVTMQPQGTAGGVLPLGMSSAMTALLGPITAPSAAAGYAQAAGHMSAAAAAAGTGDMSPVGIHGAGAYQAGAGALPGSTPEAAKAAASPAAAAAAAAAAPDEEQADTPFGTADDAAFALQISVSQQLESLLEEQQQQPEYAPVLEGVAEEEGETEITEASDGTQSTQATEATEVVTQDISQMELNGPTDQEVLQPLLPGSSRPLAEIAHAASAAAAAADPPATSSQSRERSPSAAAAAAGGGGGGGEPEAAPEVCADGMVAPAAKSAKAPPGMGGSSQGYQQLEDQQQGDWQAAAAVPAVQEELAKSQRTHLQQQQEQRREQGPGVDEAAAGQAVGVRSTSAGQLLPGEVVESLNLSASFESGVAPDAFLKGFVGGLPWAATQLPQHQPSNAPAPAVAAAAVGVGVPASPAASKPGAADAGEPQQQQAGALDATRSMEMHSCSSVSPAAAAPPAAGGSTAFAVNTIGSGAGSGGGRLSGLPAAGRYRGPGLSRRGRSSVGSLAAGHVATPAAAAAAADCASPDIDPVPAAAAGIAAAAAAGGSMGAVETAAAQAAAAPAINRIRADGTAVEPAAAAAADGLCLGADDVAMEGAEPATDDMCGAPGDVMAAEGQSPAKNMQQKQQQQQQQQQAVTCDGLGGGSRSRGRRGAKAAGTESAANPAADTAGVGVADESAAFRGGRGKGRNGGKGSRGGGSGRGRRGGKALQTTPVAALDLSAPNGLPEWLHSPAAAAGASALGEAVPQGAGLLAALQQQGVQPQPLYGSPENLRAQAAVPVTMGSAGLGAAAGAATGPMPAEAAAVEPSAGAGVPSGSAAAPPPDADPSPAPLQARLAAAKAASGAAAGGGGSRAAKRGTRRSRSPSPAAAAEDVAAEPSLGKGGALTGAPPKRSRRRATTGAAEVQQSGVLQQEEGQQQVLVPLQSAAALPPAGSRKRGRGGGAMAAGAGTENQPPADAAGQEDKPAAKRKAGRPKSAPASADALAETAEEEDGVAAAVQEQQDEEAGRAGAQEGGVRKPLAKQGVVQRKRGRAADATARQQSAAPAEAAAAAQATRGRQRGRQQSKQHHEAEEEAEEEVQQPAGPAAGDSRSMQQQHVGPRRTSAAAAASSSRSAQQRGTSSSRAAAASPSAAAAGTISSRDSGSLSAAAALRSARGPGSSGSKAGVKVTLRGMHTEERERWAKLLRKLKVRFQAEGHTFMPDTTHIVSPQLKRAEKTFCGMAAGAWLLGESWLEACEAAGRLVEEEEHELQECWDPDVISPGAPAYWRERARQLQQGAFQGLTALLYRPGIKAASSKTAAAAAADVSEVPLDTLKRVVAAGEGQVLASKPPFTQQLLQGAAKPLVVVVLGNADPTTDRNIAAAVAAGVPCVSPAYLVEWLVHPSRSLAGHYLAGTAAPLELLQLEVVRGQHGIGGEGADAQPEMSVSF